MVSIADFLFLCIMGLIMGVIALFVIYRLAKLSNFIKEEQLQEQYQTWKKNNKGL